MSRRSSTRSLDPSSGWRRRATTGSFANLRIYFQYQFEDEFVAVVERITGRTVRGFVSGIDTKADISTEAFYLELVSQRRSL